MVIRQISRLQGSKNCRIWPILGVSGLWLQFEFTNGYEMLHKAWNSKGEMPYRFPRSSIKFQGHTGQTITDFDPNCAFQDFGRSQLSNPSDLPCCLVVVVVTLFSNIIHEQNTSNTNLTNKAYPGYCKHVLCWRPPEKAYEMLHKAWNRRDALSFSKIIHQISRSHGTNHICLECCIWQ